MGTGHHPPPGPGAGAGAGGIGEAYPDGKTGRLLSLHGNWPMIALKTWLETGENLSTPGSLMYT